MAVNGTAAGTLSVVVSDASRAADDIFLFDLRHKHGADLPEFTAGSHISLRVPNGLERKYSLCNDPAERDRYVIAVKREADGRGGSVSLVDGAQAGDELLISTPRNDFGLLKSPAGYLFIAGGIGITLYYCARTPGTTAFGDVLGGPQFRGLVTIHHDGGDPARALDLWPLLERPKGHLYCCGPRSMMQAVRDMTGHWSPSSVHFEAFAEPPKRSPQDQPFRVRLMRSGDVIDVPVGVTILEALRGRGHTVPSSCESGTCGTCRTKLLGGEADHRDLVLTESEQTDNIMLCVSRARSAELRIDR
jgi:phthalate 4,5-dioxygenase reductase subunit